MPQSSDSATALSAGDSHRTTTRAARTRFAPSPTGFQHIGGFRTALFSWLLARHTGGHFLLRIEDTDTARTVPGAVEAVIEGFKWLGLDIDEGPEVGGPYGPYFQTQRRDLYLAYAEQLIAGGHAYRCFCSPERLQRVREEQRSHGEPPRYDRHCRYLTADDIAARLNEGQGFTVRLASPTSGKTIVKDALRSEIVFENASLDDAVLLKSNGLPTYHLASVIDDHLMLITHVLRAEEWIPSAPLHLITYRALGWEPPIFAHVPDVLSAQGGKKLSKRFGAIPMLEYRDRGFLPQALVNYMALLGWSYDDKSNVLSREELVAAFDLDRVGVAPARYDEERLLWFNGYYIRQLSPEELTERAMPFMERAEAEGGLPDSVARPLDRSYTARVLRLEQERMKTLAEAPGMTSFFFVTDVTYEPQMLIAKNMDAARTLDGLRRSYDALSAFADWEAAPMEARLRELVAELGLKPVQLFTSLRVAVTGRTVSPPLFETMETLGRPTSMRRLALAIDALRAHTAGAE
ncbi:MAG TPA: glutamate--tRNA ligase [Ktedonobacterales bacterium]|jgi:glutamyl-tRNA synthetase|nr:glutamate--tRNA ligase [Ktedonobacterales bacterium]